MVEKSLKILAIQMSSKIGDKKANFKNVQDLIETNAFYNPDIIVLPEVWTVGWKPAVFKDSAEELESSETVEFLSQIAKKYNVNVIGGSFITRRQEGKKAGGQANKLFSNSAVQPFSYYNTCPVLNRNGELVATYDKMHLFSYYGCAEGSFVENGQNPVMIEIEGVKIGLTICYDIRFPEIYRAYAKAGADVLINTAAWPLTRAIHWEALTKARAIENQCHMVALTQSGHIEGDEWNLGHSRIIDYKGDVLAEIEEGEGAMFAELKFKEMYEFRNKCTVLLDIHDTYDVQ